MPGKRIGSEMASWKQLLIIAALGMVCLFAWSRMDPNAAARLQAWGLDPALAKRIADDMADEPRSRLEQIKASLEGVTTKDFWEIIDRGRNFEYMPPRQRGQMTTFFAWVDEEAALAAAGATSPVATDGA